MSWTSYIDNLTASKFAKSAIVGLNGSVWAASPGFSPAKAEIDALKGGFDHPDNLRATGFKVANVKYFTLQADDKLINGKQGTGGCLVAKTKQAMVVAVYNEALPPGVAVEAVFKMQNYLVNNGY